MTQLVLCLNLMPYPGHGSGPGLYISLFPTLESKELPPESNQFLISQVREEMRMTVEKDRRNGTLQPGSPCPRLLLGAGTSDLRIHGNFTEQLFSTFLRL